MVKITTFGLLRVGAVIAWLVHPSSAQPGSTGSFLYPEARVTGTSALADLPPINVFDYIKLEWNSDYDSPSLILYCLDLNTNFFLPVDDQDVAMSGDMYYSLYDRVDAATHNWTDETKCHFKLVDEHNGFDGLNFFIKSEDSLPVTTFARLSTITQISTSSRPTPTAPPNTLASSIVSPTASDTSTMPPTASPKSQGSGSGGISTGAKAGIAVGVVCGAAIIAVVGYLLHKNNRKLREIESRMSVHEGHKSAAVTYAFAETEKAPRGALVELDSAQGLPELVADGAGVRR